MSAVDIAAIRERLAAATPGPWLVYPYDEGLVVSDVIINGIVEVARVDSPGPHDGGLDDAAYDDLDLIANAPSDLAALCDEVERLRAQEVTLIALAQLVRRYNELVEDAEFGSRPIRGPEPETFTVLMRRVGDIVDHYASENPDLLGRVSAEIDALTPCGRCAGNGLRYMSTSVCDGCQGTGTVTS